MIAFFCFLPHTEVDYLETTLLEYHSLTKYILSMETSLSHQDFSGQHFHFFCDLSPQDYHNYGTRVFRKKYKLRGQAKPGLARQYGKVKEIHDLNRMAAYTLKDNNFRTNMEPCIIQNLLSLSFKKQDKQKTEEKIFIFLKDTLETDPFILRRKILEYFRSSSEKTNKSLGPTISRNYLNNILIKYMLFYDQSFALDTVEFFLYTNV